MVTIRPIASDDELAAVVAFVFEGLGIDERHPPANPESWSIRVDRLPEWRGR
jgi:hypothetical protein